MYRPETALSHKIQVPAFPEFSRFMLEHRKFIRSHAFEFNPMSCEYNFANLFVWQNACRLSWTVYQDRILIYDGLENRAFMPLGPEISPEGLAELSRDMKKSGLSGNFCLAPREYIEKFPEIEKYYRIAEEPDHAEYIYETEKLVVLSGVKLHKKRNLISQFRHLWPDFKICMLDENYFEKSLDLCTRMMNRHKPVLPTLVQEFCAMEKAFENFDELELEGLVLLADNRIAAFCVFSLSGPMVYDIQFEKSDPDFKGAAQVINQETARYLQRRCRFLNREQDLGIKGLRQAKMSYEPLKLITPYSLVFIC